MKSDIEKIVFYDSKVYPAVLGDYSPRTSKVEVDSMDIHHLKFILKKYKPKNPIYKASANSLFGLVFIDREMYKIRVSKETIFIGYGDKRHYFITNDDDRLWLEEFLNKYKSKLSSLSSIRE